MNQPFLPTAEAVCPECHAIYYGYRLDHEQSERDVAAMVAACGRNHEKFAKITLVKGSVK
jgi:hypothetical protein